MGRVKSLSERGALRDEATQEWQVPLPEEMQQMVRTALSAQSEGPHLSDRFKQKMQDFLDKQLHAYLQVIP